MTDSELDELAPPGWFQLAEAKAIAAAAAKLRPHGQYVEVGTWAGRSAFMLAHLLPQAWKISTVDAYIAYPEGFFDTGDQAVLDTMQDTPAVIAAKALAPFPNVERFLESSTMMAVRWQGKHRPAIDIMLIDGWHAPEAVKADATAWLVNMAAKSMVFFHDAHHWRFGADVQKGIAAVRWTAGWRRDPRMEAGSLECWTRN